MQNASEVTSQGSNTTQAPSPPPTAASPPPPKLSTQEPPSNSSHKRSDIALIVGLVAAALLLGMLAVAAFVMARMMRQRKTDKSGDVRRFVNAQAHGLRSGHLASRDPYGAQQVQSSLCLVASTCCV